MGVELLTGKPRHAELTWHATVTQRADAVVVITGKTLRVEHFEESSTILTALIVRAAHFLPQERRNHLAAIIRGMNRYYAATKDFESVEAPHSAYYTAIVDPETESEAEKFRPALTGIPSQPPAGPGTPHRWLREAAVATKGEKCKFCGELLTLSEPAEAINPDFDGHLFVLDGQCQRCFRVRIIKCRLSVHGEVISVE